MRTLFPLLIAVSLLAACARSTTELENNNFASSTKSVVIHQTSTASFSPTTTKALYQDCAGAILYNVDIDGSNDSSLSFQAISMPQLGRWYTYDSAIFAPQPGPSLISHGIEQANPAVQAFVSAIKFVATDSEHVAFVFQVSYPNGKVLRGTASLPLTSGRQVQCQ